MGISYVMSFPDAMLFQRWHKFCDAGPILGQHWFNALCLRWRQYEHGTANATHYRKHMLD